MRKLETESDAFAFGDKLIEKWYGTVEKGSNKGILLVVTTNKDGALTGGPKFLKVCSCSARQKLERGSCSGGEGQQQGHGRKDGPYRRPQVPQGAAFGSSSCGSVLQKLLAKSSDKGMLLVVTANHDGALTGSADLPWYVCSMQWHPKPV